MTVDEALLAYGDGSDRFSDEAAIDAGYVLAAEVNRLREALAAMNAIAVSRAQLLKADTTHMTQQSAKLARVGALLARWNKNALERPTALSAPRQLAEALKGE